VDRDAELILIDRFIAEHGVRRGPTVCVCVTRDLFTPVLIAQKIAAMRLPPSRRPSWVVLLLARLDQERRAYSDGMSVKEYRARAALVA
jgi:hypothetical protein